MKRALVLAGGGVAGIAWELGVLRGIQDTDPDLQSRLTAADIVVGTSAGSAVAAQITRRGLAGRLRREPAVARHPRASRTCGTGDRPGPGGRPRPVLELAGPRQRTSPGSGVV